MQTQKKHDVSAPNWQETALQKLESTQLARIQKKCTCGACNPPKPKLPDGMRRLKVQPKYVDRRGNNPYVPLIMLKGEWLRKTGFDCEAHVIITNEPGQLITVLKSKLTGMVCWVAGPADFIRRVFGENILPKS